MYYSAKKGEDAPERTTKDFYSFHELAHRESAIPPELCATFRSVTGLMPPWVPIVAPVSDLDRQTEAVPTSPRCWIAPGAFALSPRPSADGTSVTIPYLWFDLEEFAFEDELELYDPDLDRYYTAILSGSIQQEELRDVVFQLESSDSDQSGSLEPGATASL